MACTVIEDGRRSVGSVAGEVTVTVNEPVAVLPRVSDAEQLTVVVVIANVEPEAGVHVGPPVTPTLSVAVTV